MRSGHLPRAGHRKIDEIDFASLREVHLTGLPFRLARQGLSGQWKEHL
jgi:hypothetical protein